MARRVAVETPAALRNLADQFKDKIKSGIVVLGSTAGDKVMLIAVVTKDLTDRYHAGNIVTASPPWSAAGAEAGRTWRRPAVTSRKSWIRRWKKPMRLSSRLVE